MRDQDALALGRRRRRRRRRDHVSTELAGCRFQYDDHGSEVLPAAACMELQLSRPMSLEPHGRPMFQFTSADVHHICSRSLAWQVASQNLDPSGSRGPSPDCPLSGIRLGTWPGITKNGFSGLR